MKQSGRSIPRAMRLHQPEDAIVARLEALRIVLGQDGERHGHLARMLRRERRAALTGIGYDAARHAALRRLADELQPKRKRPVR